MPVTYENNEPANAIIDAVGPAREALQQHRESLREIYWEHHAAVAKHGFKRSSYQTDALRKLGQVAEALGKVEAAHAALARVQCWND